MNLRSEIGRSGLIVRDGGDEVGDSCTRAEDLLKDGLGLVLYGLWFSLWSSNDLLDSGVVVISGGRCSSPGSA